MQIEGAQNPRMQTPTSGVVVAAPFAATAAWLRPREAALIEAEWADLAANAVEANPFYSPALLIPALGAFANAAMRLAIARDARGRLVALAPVAPCRGYSHLPVQYLATWMHEHCFFAAPLIRRGAEREALSALFDLVEGEGAFLRLRHLDANGPIFAAAASIALQTNRLSTPSSRYERAMLGGGKDAEACLQRALSGKKRKELRRQRARLEEQGAVTHETLSSPRDIDAWTEEFLAMEASGWKGAQGTALASSGEGRKFFEGAVRHAFAAGSLDFHRLAVDGKPIAMIANFIENGAGFSFKIAYDEAYARFSPGVLLEIELMRALERRDRLSFIDSCAARDHPMINSLWRDRRAIAALNISGRRAEAKFLFRILTGLELLGERLRRVKDELADDNI